MSGRVFNGGRVWRLLYNKGGMTCGQAGRELRMSPGSVADVLRRLRVRGYAKQDGMLGRHPRWVALGYEAPVDTFNPLYAVSMRKVNATGNGSGRCALADCWPSPAHVFVQSSGD